MINGLPHEHPSDTIFKFEFYPMNHKNKCLPYVVYGYHQYEIDLFINQHGFDRSLLRIIPMGINEFDDNPSHILRPHVFKSNSSDEIFTIMTSENIVTNAIESCASTLSSISSFGIHAIEVDIPFIEFMNDKINSMTHGIVLEHTALDEMGSPLSENWEKYCKRTYNDNELQDVLAASIHEGMNDEFIYVSLCDNYIGGDLPEPITIEAYIEYFTSMIMDVFE